MKTLSTIMFTAMLAVHAYAQSMTTHSDTTHGFRLSYPSDWTVKQGETEDNVFKAVKHLISDRGYGGYLMLTVNAQTLDRSDYNMSEFEIGDVVSGFTQGYGEDNLTLMSSGRKKVSGLDSIWFLVDKHHPQVKPRVEYCIAVVKGRHLYNVAASCSKPKYQQHADLIKQLGDSFTLTASARAVASDSTSDYRLVVREPGEKPGPAFLKAFGSRWVKYLILGIVFAAGSALWAKIKGKKETGDAEPEN